MHVTLSPDDEKHTRQNLRATIERGYQQSLRGEGVDGEQFLAALETEIDKAEQAQRGE